MLTNTTFVSAYRGAGRPEGNFFIERLLDAAAREMNIDPTDIRRRNFIKPSQMPFKAASGFTYDSGTDKAYGRATLTVEVEVLFFSTSVELTVERAFGGESGDPLFGDMYDPPDKWRPHALAFA